MKRGFNPLNEFHSVLCSILITMMSTLISYASEASEKSMLVYCTSAPKINFDLSLEMPESGGHVYALTAPLIGKDGVIEKFHFSSDSKTFEAKIHEGFKFAISGERVTSRDVANSLAVALNARHKGYYRVAGTRNKSPSEIWDSNVSGIETPDELTLKITFESDDGALNIPGRLTDLMDRNVPSIKGGIFVGKPMKNRWDFVARFPLISSYRNFIFSIYGKPVELRSSIQDCKNADFLDTPPSKMKLYAVSNSSYDLPRMAILNTNTLSYNERILVSSALRRGVAEFSGDLTYIRLEPSHFRSTEAKGDANIDWDRRIPHIKLDRPRELTIVIPKPFQSISDIITYTKNLKKIFFSLGISIKFEWAALPVTFKNQDVGIFAFATANGRQKWVEGAFHVLNFMEPLKRAPKTTEKLNECRRNASATVPINERDLLEVDKYAFEERSIVPLYRNFSRSFYKIGSPIKYVYSDKTYATFELH